MAQITLFVPSPFCTPTTTTSAHTSPSRRHRTRQQHPAVVARIANDTDVDTPSNHTDSRDTQPTSDQPAAASERRNNKQVAKELLTLYGPAYIGASMASSLISIPAWYFLVAIGVDVPHWLQVLGDFLEVTPIGRPGALQNLSPELGTFTLAYIAHKVSSPLRFPLVVAATPWLAKNFKELRGKVTK